MQMFSFKFLPPTLIFSPLFIRTMTFSGFKSRAAEQFSGNYVTKTFFFNYVRIYAGRCRHGISVLTDRGE